MKTHGNNTPARLLVVASTTLLALAVALVVPARAGAIAFNFDAGQVGNQGHGGSLGNDFTVNYPIRVTDIGVFDDVSNGISGTLTAQIWNRSGDTGTLVPGTTMTFSNADPGTLEGSVRLKPLPSSVVLMPGTYTIASYGHSGSDQNLNSNVGGFNFYTEGGGPPVGGSGFPSTSAGFPITFEQDTRYAAGSGFPSSDDSALLYGSGTFQFRGVLHEGPINLFRATATHEQQAPLYAAYKAIDTDPSSGWAVLSATNTAAVFQAVDEVGFYGLDTLLTFTMDQDSPYANHLVNHFRLSVTTDPDPNVTSGATWTTLLPDSLQVYDIAGHVVSPTESALMSLVLDDTTGVISATGTSPGFARYLITAKLNMSGITGFRLETGIGGSSGFPGNNFVLTNLAVSQLAVPEPSTFALAGLALLGLVGCAYRRRPRRH